MDLEMMKQLLAMALTLAEKSSDPELKKSAADFAKSLGDQVAALGIDPAAAEPAAPEPAAELAASDPTPPAVPAPAAAGACAPGQDPRAMASRARPITEADVQRLMAEDRQRRDILASNRDRPGMTPAMTNLLAGKSLREVREVIAALPARPAPPAANAIAGATAGPAPGAQPLQTGPVPALGETQAAATALTVDEQFVIRRMGTIMAPDPTVVADVRARMAAGKPTGIVARPHLRRLAAAKPAS